MKPGGQVTAAIQILIRISETSRPAEQVLRNWGQRNRIAGARDRAKIGQYVFRVLRHRSRCAWRMGNDDARSLMIGYLALSPIPREEWTKWFDGEGHAPSRLTEDEMRILDEGPSRAPSIAEEVSVPEWLVPEFEKAFGDDTKNELEALLSRAPVDLLVNTTKVARKAARAHLRRQEIETRATPHSASGLRVDADSRVGPRQITQSKTFQEGEIDIQDEGSQLIVDFCDLVKGQQVVDLCAGGGGKTLGLSYALKNSGQIYACDVNERRLTNMMSRLARADVRNVQMRQLIGWVLNGDEADPNLGDLAGKADLVLVDAPCSGTGSWRRHPDAKWRLTQDAVASFPELQAQILDRAALLVKPGGRLVYATCSLLPCENDECVSGFLSRNSGFVVEALETDVPVRRTDLGVLLTPLQTETDGFYISRLLRRN